MNLFSLYFMLFLVVQLSSVNGSTEPADQKLANDETSKFTKSGLGKSIEDKEKMKPPTYFQLPPPSTLFQSQPAKLRQDFSTLPIVVNADRISRLLRKLANEDMGVYPMQTILDGMLYRSEPFDHAEEVKKMAESADSRIEDIKRAVHEIRLASLALFDRAPIDVQVFRHYRECCTLDKQSLIYSSRYSAWINSSFTCDVLPQRRLSAFSFYPGRNLAPVFVKNAERDPSIRWQYFSTADGIHTEFPAHHFDDHQNLSRCLIKARHRRWNAFIGAALPFLKSVVIIIDRGSGVSPSQLETGKCIAKSLISSLNEKDKVSVLSIGSSVSYPSICDKHDGSSRFPFASHSIKARLTYFVDSFTRDSERANHTLAFESAFDLYWNYFISNAKDDSSVFQFYPSIIYISRGLLSEITEARQVLATILKGIHRTRQAAKGGWSDQTRSIQINTVALTEPGKLVIWETQFLQDVAHKNFSKHKLRGQAEETGGNGVYGAHSNHGKMLVVNATSNVESGCVVLSDVLALLDHADYANDDSGAIPKPELVLTNDPFEPAFLSIAIGVRWNGRLLGVAGIDVNLADLLSPAIFYTSTDTSAYAAVTDVNGFVLYHPKSRMDEDGTYSSLSSKSTFELLEDWPKDDSAVLRAFGLEEVMHKQWYNFYHAQFDDHDNVSYWDRVYYRRKAANGFLTFIISAVENLVSQGRKGPGHDSKVHVQHALSYHRLDFRLNKDVRLCYHGRALSSFERAGVFLSPRAFERPDERGVTPETKHSAQGYWAYTTDDTRLITNPGLKHGVRQELGAFSKIAYEWRKQEEKSSHRLSVVRKYLATPSGILLMYPATVVEQNYDPVLADWYRKALENPGRVVLSRAHLDPHGFGSLVTISHTVYEGKSAMHRPGDSVVAVMAIDVPLTFLYKLLYDSISICREPGMDCFLFNEHGYVIANRHAFTSDDQASVSSRQHSVTELTHLAHREPSVASEILQRKGFAVKTTCARFVDQTIQRFYTFNTSFTDVLRSNDGCFRYQIAVVPQTNVFLAIVNKSCHRHSSFCPCSVNDRRCFNCHRGLTEPSESWCECPCECPLDHVWCPLDHLETLATCWPPTSPVRPAHLDGHFLSTGGNTLPTCLPIQCSEFNTENVCRGVMGCEWCSYDTDGRTPLNTPYCASLNSCFGGVQGLVAYPEEEEDIPYDSIAVPTPVGPIAGGIMGIFVLLMAGIYWYRHHVVRLVDARHGRYSSSGSASCLQRFDDSAEEGYHFDDGSGGAGNGGDDKGPLAGGNALLLASFERQNLGAGQAPRPRYRPGPRTESSDPGYSTMTGNCDDSEQATTVGPLGNGGRLGRLGWRWPTLAGHRPGPLTKSQKKTSPVAMVDDPPEMPGATVLSNPDAEVNAGKTEPAEVALMSRGNSPPPGSTNIVTMALIHHHPTLAET